MRRRLLTDAGRDGRGLRAVVREVLDDLIAYVRPLTHVPHPISRLAPGPTGQTMSAGAP